MDFLGLKNARRYTGLRDVLPPGEIPNKGKTKKQPEKVPILQPVTISHLNLS
jgi:hypothetical protein